MSLPINADTMGSTDMPLVFISGYGNINISNSFQTTVTGGSTIFGIGGNTTISSRTENGLTNVRAAGGDVALALRLDPFAQGSDAVITGLSARDFTLNPTDLGAPGSPVLELQILPNPGGVGLAPTSVDLPGYTTADLATGRLTAQFDVDPLTGASALHIHAND